MNRRLWIKKEKNKFIYNLEKKYLFEYCSFLFFIRNSGFCRFYLVGVVLIKMNKYFLLVGEN